MGEPTLYLFRDNEPLRLSTGRVHRIRLSAPRFESDLPLRQLEGVAKTFELPAFGVWLRGLFGRDVPREACEQLGRDLRVGALAMPKLKLKQQVPHDRLAAYDADQNEMLFAYALVQRAVEEEDDEGRWLLVAALLEEFGHHVDYLLRNQYTMVGGDAPRDEGAKFAYALLNLDWAGREQTQVARLVYPFGTRAIDARWTAYRDKIKPWLDGAQQEDSDRWRQYEFFGAGRGKEGKHNLGHSFGHASIEDALAKVHNTPFEGDALVQVYFGNWLRDYSQLIVPPTLKVFSREFLTKLLDLTARSHFDDKPEYRVTPAILGVYRAEDHLDNPHGLADGTGDDPDLNRAYVAAQCQIDEHTWLQKHLRSSVGGCTSGFERIQHWLRESMSSRDAERYRHFGAALHALEDFYAHSNFIEVMLVELGHKRVYPWTAPFTAQRGGKPCQLFPVVTGCFGGFDTAASLMLEVGEDLQKMFKCQRGQRTKATEIARLALHDWRPTWGARYESLLAIKDNWGKGWQWFDKVMCESIEALSALLKYAIGGVVRLMGNQIDEAQTLFLSDGESFNPTHTQLAKDHDDHPLHELAAHCAMIAVREVGGLMADAWSGLQPLDAVIAAVSSFMTHPAQISDHSPASEVRTLIADWAEKNRDVVQRLASRSWIEDASKSEEWKALRERAAKLTAEWDKVAAEAQSAHEQGPESYARKQAAGFGDLLQRTLSDTQSHAVTTFAELLERAQQKRAELGEDNLRLALAQLRELVDSKTLQLQERSFVAFRDFALSARQKYREVTSERVQAAYRAQASAEAERIMQELRGWSEDKIMALSSFANEKRSQLDGYVAVVEPMELASAKVARIRAIFSEGEKRASEAAARTLRELRELASDIKAELDHTAAPTELSLLLEQEAARLDAKLRALAARVASTLSDPTNQAELEQFVHTQVADFRSLLEQVLDDAQSSPQGKQVAKAAGQELDRIHAELRKPVDEVSERAPDLSGELQSRVSGARDSDKDAQLEYVEKLRSKTRGIEEGRRH